VLYGVISCREKIGLLGVYILIDRHLEGHPDKRLVPLFDFFEPWCQDENRTATSSTC